MSIDIKNNTANEDKKVLTEKRQSCQVGDYIYYTPCIGKGSFSEVFIGHHINDDIAIAIKRTRMSENKKIGPKRIQREISLLKQLDHPNVLKFITYFTDIADNIYIVTEYYNYRDLSIYTKGKNYLSMDLIHNYFIQLRNGLFYLLSKNILHRDIKPQNILLHQQDDKITIKIADLGFARHFETDKYLSQTLCGTPLYLAPEVINTNKHLITSDLWSIGVILYELIYHTLPFKKPKNLLELNRSQFHMKLKFPNRHDGTIIDEQLKDLLTGLLETNPEKRTSWGNFFNHPWFPSLDEKMLSMTDEPTESIEQNYKLQESIASSFIQQCPIPEELQELVKEIKEENVILDSKINIIDDYYTKDMSLSKIIKSSTKSPNINSSNSIMNILNSSISYGLNSLNSLISSSISKDSLSFLK